MSNLVIRQEGELIEYRKGLHRTELYVPFVINQYSVVKNYRRIYNELEYGRELLSSEGTLTDDLKTYRLTPEEREDIRKSIYSIIDISSDKGIWGILVVLFITLGIWAIVAVMLHENVKL